MELWESLMEMPQRPFFKRKNGINDRLQMIETIDRSNMFKLFIENWQNVHPDLFVLVLADLNHHRNNSKFKRHSF